MNFETDHRTRAHAEAGAALGKTCIGLSPAQAGEDWRRAEAKSLLRSIGATAAAVYLDAYAAAGGSLRAARSHAEDTIATAPQIFEAVLLAGAVEGLLREVVYNVRLPVETRPDGFPSEKDPDVRHALADARAWSQIARNLALRAAWLHEAGTPTTDVKNAPPAALVAACDAVLKVWTPLSRLVIGEEAYVRYETELFRAAARLRPAALAQVATAHLGERVKREERR